MINFTTKISHVGVQLLDMSTGILPEFTRCNLQTRPFRSSWRLDRNEKLRNVVHGALLLQLFRHFARYLRRISRLHVLVLCMHCVFTRPWMSREVLQLWPALRRCCSVARPIYFRLLFEYRLQVWGPCRIVPVRELGHVEALASRFAVWITG